jgi:peptidoglycan/LPS O-acetylase OafA/YrhL
LAESPAQRFFFFDVLRGVSAQMVLVGHALNVFFPAVFMTVAPDGLLQARPLLPYVQNLGVLVFFCISGYLVTASVMRRSASASYGLADFLLDRFARIFTPLVPLLLLLYAAENAFGDDGARLPWLVLNVGLDDLLLNLTMLFDHPAMSALANLTGVDVLRAGAFGSAEQLWTVVIEWWIYVTFGILALAVVRRRRPDPALLIALAIAAMVPAWALVRGNGLIVAWITGMLFCLGSAKLADVRRELLLLLAASCAALGGVRLLFVQWNFYDGVAACLLSSGICLTAVALADLRPPRPGPLSRLAAGLSEISYSVYLVHLSVLMWLLVARPELSGSAGGLALGILLANALAAAFWWAFERHYPLVRRTIGRHLAPFRTAACRR